MVFCVIINSRFSSFLNFKDVGKFCNIHVDQRCLSSDKILCTSMKQLLYEMLVPALDNRLCSSLQ